MTQIDKNREFRECGMLVTCGAQSVGKSHQNKILICNYIKDKLDTKVKGRKVLMLDTNGEFGPESFGSDGIPALDVKRIAVKDIPAWCKAPVIEARRIDMKNLSIDEKLEIFKYVFSVSRNILLCIEDINTVIIDVTHAKDIVSGLVNLRHKAVDVIISYQSLRAVEPRILSNCRYLRLHYSVGDFDDIKGKLSEPEVFKIAQLLINERYFKGDKRFFLYIHTNPHKIEGAFTKKEFLEATAKYLRINKKRLRDQMEITKCTMEQAVVTEANQMLIQFYGNEK